MRKDNITEDFDLFVKGSLLNAEETPSPRVWQAIESRLPAAATAPVVGGFRRGWLAVAAAAAVAAFSILRLRRHLPSKWQPSRRPGR